MKILPKIKAALMVLPQIRNPLVLRLNSSWYSKKKGVVLLRKGLSFKIRGGESDLKEVIKVNLLDEYPRQHLKDIDQEGVAIDVGSHIGSFSIMLHALHPRVQIYAIEPVKENFDLLQENVRRNNASGQIKTLQCGVSNYNGHRTFKSFQGMDSCHLDADSKQETHQDGDVRIARLEDLTRELGVSKIEVLKMDVEGEEYKILPDIIKLLKTVKILALEYHQILNNKMIFPNGEAEITQLLNGNGFTPVHKTRNIMIWKKQ